MIRLVNTQADLCEQVSNVDLSCPIEKGKTTITKDVELPKEIPPVGVPLTSEYLVKLIKPQGKYSVFADAYTKGGKKIICLEATIQFGGK